MFNQAYLAGPGPDERGGNKLDFNLLSKLARTACAIPYVIGNEERHQLHRELSQLLIDRELGATLIEQIDRLPLARQRTALLDLVLVARALTVNGIAPANNIAAAIELLSTKLGMLPTLTYELIILSNPAEQTRTFTAGVTGVSERRFYLGHQKIEGLFLGAVRETVAAISALSRGQMKDAASYLQSVSDLLTRSTQVLAQDFLPIDPQDFAKFRRYLDPSGGYQGPSGLHSAVVHALRFLVFGEALTTRIELVERHRSYFPRQHDGILDSSIALARQKRSIVDMTRLLPPGSNLIKVVAHLCDLIIKHTEVHFHVVRRMISDLSSLGTAEQQIGVFLGSALSAMKKSAESLGTHNSGVLDLLQMPPDRVRQYRSAYYQRTAELESRAKDGMDLGRRYENEAKFALSRCNLTIDPTDKVLDLACGTGGHAQLFRQLTGASVEARDISAYAIEQAIVNDQILRSKYKGKATINFAVGNMGDIKMSLNPNDTFALITILGSSFMYLESKKAHQQALADYFSILRNGGRLVIQWRDTLTNRDMTVETRASQELGVKTYFTDDRGEVYEDCDLGDGCFRYNAEVSNKDGLIHRPAENGSLEGWYDSDGVLHYAFGRVYFDKSGNKQDLGTTEIINYMTTSAAPILTEMLKSAGFKNIRLEQAELSPGGARVLVALIAEKEV